MSAPAHVIARARAEHLAALAEIERAAEARFSLADLPIALRGDVYTIEDHAEALRAGLLWVALEAGGAPVGFAVALGNGDELHLDEIDVHPGHQGRGLGRALVDAVIAEARARRCARLTLTTFRFAAWNQPWYARLGFVELSKDACSPALAAIFEEEIARGLARERRVAMALELPR